MPVDWNVFSSALQLSRNGENLKALAKISGLMADAESDTDRAALALGQATCHSHLGNAAKSAELLELARKYAGEDRFILSQVALSEASLRALKREYDAACEQYKSIKSECHDLLIRPENDDFAMELDSRLACTLVDAERYREALPIFGKRFERTALEDKQRLQLFFSFALLRTGRITQAQPILFEAARGEDRDLAQLPLATWQRSKNLLDDSRPNITRYTGDQPAPAYKTGADPGFFPTHSTCNSQLETRN